MQELLDLTINLEFCNLVLLKKVCNKNLVYSEADYLHEDHHVGLDTLRVTEANNLLAIPYQFNEGHFNSFANHKWNGILHLFSQDMLKFLLSSVEVILELMTPVFDEGDSTLLAYSHILFEDADQLSVVIAKVYDSLITPTVMVNVTEASLTELEGDKDPEQVHERFAEISHLNDLF